MNYISVKAASEKIGISTRRIQKLCEEKRILGCMMVSGVWLIPESVEKPIDKRLSDIPNNENIFTLSELCKILSISLATGRNWIKLGKLKPKYSEKKTPYFTKSYVQLLKKSIYSDKNDLLKHRRNKKFISGNSLYNSYVSDKCKNLSAIQSLINLAEKEAVELTDNNIQYLIVNCALHLFISKKNIKINNKDYPLLKSFINNKLNLNEYNTLLLDLIPNKQDALHFINKYPMLFSFDYQYEANEDTLGLIYISCKNLGNRKTIGAYYTPTKIVKKLISHLVIKKTDKILDPCCGTGNFILQLPESIPFEKIFANDIDPISVKITRLNIALKYANAKIENIYKQITISNYLTEYNKTNFSHIIGNPPWGYNFNDNEKNTLRTIYKATSNSNIESYDIFIEKSLKLLSKQGQISFVLPEAILTVKAHTDIREIILNQTDIKNIDYLGNAFDKVQCPSIIMRLEQTNNKINTVGMNIDTGTNSFVIKTQRLVSSANFSFITTDDEYKILEKIKNHNNCTTLFNKADFALGIVTGNNKDYLSSQKTDSNEIILKGSDIYKYHIKPANNYIIYKPETFQQVAPTEMYRAKEKLLYRFISNQLIFAYDNNMTLSLNSCNILIPKIQGLHIKYILAILNSRIAQFIYKKEFNSIKVLRSHIESIPIPIINSNLQKKIIEKVDSIITENSLSKIENLYNELDSIIMTLFNLSKNEESLIINSIDKENNFLSWL